MFHSVTICGKNSWTDYNMVSAEGIVLPPAPEQKRSTIDIKTGNGVLDVSTLLTGYPIFQNRSGDLKFYILEPWEAVQYKSPWSTNNYNLPSASSVYESLLADWHTKTGTMIFEDDPDWYYKGVFTVTGFDTNALRRAVTVHYEVEPYKYSTTEFTSTLTGVGVDYDDSSKWVNHYFTKNELGYMPVCPTFTFTGTFGQNEVAYVRVGGDHLTAHARAKGVTAARSYRWPDMFLYSNWDGSPTTVAQQFGINASPNISVTVTFNKGRL